MTRRDRAEPSSWGGRKIAEIRLRLVNTYGNLCHLCRTPIDLSLSPRSPGGLTIDHLVPRSLGGADNLENLRPAHRRCNLSRGRRPAGAIRPPRRPEVGLRFFAGSSLEAPPATSISPRTP